jgi:carbonic anhydrase
LESAVKKLMQDLEKQKGQNNLLSEQIIELEKLLNENKVAWHYHLIC